LAHNAHRSDLFRFQRGHSADRHDPVRTGEDWSLTLDLGALHHAANFVDILTSSDINGSIQGVPSIPNDLARPLRF
jgi:hypothetical protein